MKEVYNRITMTLREHINEFRVKNALKVTIAGVICVFISNLFDLQLSYLSVLLVFLTMTQYHAHLFKIGIQGLMGALICGGLALLITYLFIDSKILYIALMVLLLFICMALISLFPLGSLLGGIISGMALFVATFTSINQATVTVNHFVVQMAIAAIVIWFVDSLIWPHRPRQSLLLTLSSVFKDYQTLFQSLNRRGYASNELGHRLSSLSLETFDHLLDLIKRTDQQQKDSSFPVDLYIKMVAYLKEIFVNTEFLENTLHKEHSFLSDLDVSTNINAALDGIALYFKNIEEALARNTGLSTDLIAELHKSTELLENHYEAMHDRKDMDQAYYEDLIDFGAMLPVIKGIVARLEKITVVYNLTQNIEEYTKLTERKLPRTPELEQIRRKQRFKITDDILKQSLKTVIIFLLLFGGEVFFNLPGGSQVSFFGILFGAVPNLGQAHLKGRLGIVGIVCGLLYGLFGLLVLSNIAYFSILLLLLFLGLFVTAYIASGNERTAFAGIQAGLLMPYMFLISNGPQLNLDLAFTRFSALIVAATIGLLILHFIWPVNPLTQLRDKLGKAFSTSGLILEKLLKLKETEEDKIKPLVVSLASALPTTTSLLKDAEYLISTNNLHSGEFIEIIECLEVIYVELETLNRAIYADIDNTLMNKYLSFMATYYKRTCSFFYYIGEHFQDQKDISSDVRSLMEEIVIQRSTFRQSGVWRDYSNEEIERNVLITSSIDGILYSLIQISDAIDRIKGVKLTPSAVYIT